MAPENGNVTFDKTLFQFVATYTCDLGYELSDGATRRCQANARWSGSQPQCTSKPELLCIVSSKCYSSICTHFNDHINESCISDDDMACVHSSRSSVAIDIMYDCNSHCMGVMMSDTSC